MVRTAKLVRRGLAGPLQAFTSTVLALGIWATGLGALWTILTIVGPWMLTYWSVPILAILLGSIAYNLIRPERTRPPRKLDDFFASWTTAMLVLSGVGLVAAPRPVEVGQVEIEVLGAYGHRPSLCPECHADADLVSPPLGGV